jgi:serine/threonine protein kinase
MILPRMVATMPGGPMNEPALVGAVLSRRFRLTSLLGQGGMGLVYEADVLAPTPPLPPRVAIKLLRHEHLHDEQVRRRFTEEGRACMRFQHPNVIHVFEVDTAEEGTPYLVMERLEGQPLNVVAPHGHPLEASRAVRIVQGVLAGLAAAHQQGIVHRDLKPENVFVLPGDNAKILDFGIAKVMDAAGGIGSRTRTGMLLGTPAFMSPEQARSARDADHRSDLWSVAVMLYEILTGRQTFIAPTEFARLTMILTAEPDAPSSASPALSPYDSFFRRALQKDRAQRFQSADEMSQALAAVANVSPVGPTLSSPQQSSRSEHPQPHPASYRPAPIVVLPSTTNDPVSFAGPPRGISQIVLVLLVSLALVAGFVLGFAVAKSM